MWTFNLPLNDGVEDLASMYIDNYLVFFSTGGNRCNWCSLNYTKPVYKVRSELWMCTNVSARARVLILISQSCIVARSILDLFVISYTSVTRLEGYVHVLLLTCNIVMATPFFQMGLAHKTWATTRLATFF